MRRPGRHTGELIVAFADIDALRNIVVGGNVMALARRPLRARRRLPPAAKLLTPLALSARASVDLETGKGQV